MEAKSRKLRVEATPGQKLEAGLEMINRLLNVLCRQSEGRDMENCPSLQRNASPYRLRQPEFRSNQFHSR